MSSDLERRAAGTAGIAPAPPEPPDAVATLPRGSLTEAVLARLKAVEGERPEVDLILLHNEISFAHGTGIQMARILSEAPPYVVFRSFDSWGGQQVVSPVADYVLHQYSQDRTTIARFIATRLGWYRVRRILSIPYTREDVVMTLTAKAVTGAPLTLWVMDDNTVLNEGIPLGEMKELVAAADARFVISEGMRDLYAGVFAETFRVLPPLVARKLIRRSPSPPAQAPADGTLRGVMVGNIWHQAWLDHLLDALAGGPIRLRWFTSSEDLYFLKLDPQRLSAAGVEIWGNVAHEQIARFTEEASFVVVPSTSLTETDGHAAAIGRVSLPSKMPFVTASAGTPFLVLANGESGAARYVERFGLGEVSTYDARRLEAAARRLSSTPVQEDIRSKSFALGRDLDATGAYAMLAAAAGGGTEADRLNRLFGGEVSDLSPPSPPAAGG